jgi:hypothetical protein
VKVFDGAKPELAPNWHPKPRSALGAGL